MLAIIGENCPRLSMHLFFCLYNGDNTNFMTLPWSSVRNLFPKLSTFWRSPECRHGCVPQKSPMRAELYLTGGLGFAWKACSQSVDHWALVPTSASEKGWSGPLCRNNHVYSPFLRLFTLMLLEAVCSLQKSISSCSLDYRTQHHWPAQQH